VTGVTGAARERPPVDEARRAAFDVLRAVDTQDAYANLLLPRMLRDRSVSGRDAAFATELTYGTLRHRGTYDEVIAACSTRPLDALDSDVLDLLRLGCHQLLSTRVPARAAVDSTVELARSVGRRDVVGFVNAVLRAVSARTLDQWVDQLAPADPVQRLAFEYSHPAWVVRALADALAACGRDAAALTAVLAADNQPPAVSLVARPGRCEPAELVAAGALPGRWSPYAARWPSGDPGTLRAVREGRAGVQDEGSQLVALATVEAPLVGADSRWLDLCAGPGGKAALLDALAAQRPDPGAHVTAVELLPHRADLVRSVVTSATTVEVGDGTDTRWGTGDHDRVLVDVPCSGLGALRRRPEARWRRQPADVAALAGLQRSLLARAVTAVRPGGVVAYSTCSPHLAETRSVVEDVARRHGDVQVLDARPAFPGVSDLGPGPFVQLWPDLHGTDAMFCALLRRSP